LKRLSLIDFQSLDGTTALLSPLLSWALKRCRDEGIHVLENVGRWLEPGELIKTAAPYQRKLPAWSYFYRASHPKLAESLRNRRAWAPSLFDGDASLCAGVLIDSVSHPRVHNRRSFFSRAQVPVHDEPEPTVHSPLCEASS